MREFKSLLPEEIPALFDAQIHGEDPIVKVTESKGRIKISYTFPGFYISDDAIEVEGEKIDFKQVNIASMGFKAESGKPLLPSFGRYVQIPYNCDYTSSVEKSEPVQFDDIIVLPAQEQLTDSPDQEYVFEYDKELYGKDLLYPEEIVKISGPFNIDDYIALLVHVTPFQYNPKKKRLYGYSNVDITFEFTPREEVATDQTIGDPRINREAFGNFFLNPSRRIDESLDIDRRMTYFPVYWLKGPEFRIIYHPSLKEAAEKLAFWKKIRGIRTKIVPLTDIGNNVDAIKNYIREERSGKSRLRYVLLFGDAELIPSYDTSNEPWQPPPTAFYGNNITDYYYSTERDPTGQGDYVLPWLSIGRIPVSTPAEGIAIVDQIISYEKTPPTESEYYDRMAFAAYFQDTSIYDPTPDGKASRAYMKTMETIRQHVSTLGYDVDRIYVSETPTVQLYKDGTPVPADVVNSIVNEATATNMLVDATSQGQLIIGHRDHGTTDGWHKPPFDSNHLAGVSGVKPSMFYSINCLTGKFDDDPTDCFAENIITMSGAAPSIIAATRVSHTWLNDSLMKALFDSMWGGVLPTFPGTTASYSVRYNRLGDIMNYAKTYLPLSMSGSEEYIKDHLEIYHVLGDPTLELWKEKPRNIRMKAWIQKSSLYIKMPPPPKDSIISVTLGKRMIKRIEPTSTTIKIPLKGVVNTSWLMRKRRRPAMYVNFWAPGYRFRQIRARTI